MYPNQRDYTIMGKQTTERSGRLVLVPCPFQGDITPMLQLGTVLYSKGFSITDFHTIYNSPDPNNYPDFSFVPIPDGLSDQDIRSWDLRGNVMAINENCRESIKRFLQQFSTTEDEKEVCIISDELLFFAEAVADDLKLPSIILRTTNAATSLARSALVKLN
ncbi:UDP-glucuronosyl/UDP-glucosyltransferase [Parasponia andersonii]|uniref:UDP-glucuronosyl/UDP-glucosyltransferase n=1 Tax=Parasponia andersonii TaxID=3476 RepID=A0A2P5A9U0_PARAD|nr:UDP-glucuronosyl/UDP-glucosyltransferase [Parasponia andersonii]